MLTTFFKRKTNNNLAQKETSFILPHSPKGDLHMFKKKIVRLVLLLGMIIFTFCSTGCTFDSDNNIYYTQIIDPLSNITFDYFHPNYALVSLNCYSSYVYTLDGSQAYSLVSDFDNIPFNNIASVNEEKYEDLIKEIAQGIDIEVGYRYSTSNTEDNDAIVHFYVLTDGTILFKNNRDTALYYSDSCAVNYDKIVQKIENIGR